MPTYDAIDLFAGPGGWDVGARDLGIVTIGIEFDHAACETRRAAGLPTIEGDVRDYRPPTGKQYTPGLIASPPCQTFSMAGKGSGRAALDQVLRAVDTLAKRDDSYGTFEDERTQLVLEPLRWALEAIDIDTPFRWLAFEQVPTVLPVWEAMAEVLRAEGYSVATGKVYAEQYGVPQTRTRAILVASLDREATLPTPTHSRYHNRTPEKLDEGVLPWVSMGDALGWIGMDGFLRSNYGTGGDASKRGERRLDQPAPTVTSKADRNRWVFRSSNAAHAAIRPITAPAPTIMFGAAGNDVRWYPEGATRSGVAEVASTRHSDSRRVTPSEASILQSFPDGYPWQGSPTKASLQIGNAVPPLLARAILKELTQ